MILSKLALTRFVRTGSTLDVFGCDGLLEMCNFIKCYRLTLGKHLTSEEAILLIDDQCVKELKRNRKRLG